MSCYLIGVSLVLSFLLAPARVWAAALYEHDFQVRQESEGIAEIIASGPDTAWKTPGREAVVARVQMDGDYNQDVVLHQGARNFVYQVFLGPLQAGKHQIRIERDSEWSAPQTSLHIDEVKIRTIARADPDYLAIAYAPIVYARADTLGHFSDLPLVMWYEKLTEGSDPLLQYSIVFSNEDSGTPTDELMARWGRASDIEYIYRITFNTAGQLQKETFQGMEHDERLFHGRKVGHHPLILVATPNNCFADTGFSAVQYRLLPVFADLSGHSREELMDRFPWTYSVMAQELEREHKIRPYGGEHDAAIGDPRNYLYLELKADNRNTGLVVWVKLKGVRDLYSSHRGKMTMVVTRSGWYRTTVELPPGTHADTIENIMLECVDMRDPQLLESDYGPSMGYVSSTLHHINKVFFLDTSFRPSENMLEDKETIVFHPGQMKSFSPKPTTHQTSALR
jgi:hypothetical protein